MIRFLVKNCLRDVNPQKSNNSIKKPMANSLELAAEKFRNLLDNEVVEA